MPALALILTLAWLVVVAGVRGYLQARRGGPPAMAFRDRPGSAQWWSRIVGAIGFALAFAAPIAGLAGLPPIAALDQGWVHVLGIALVAAGTLISVVAQVAMGSSWRGDVDPAVRTDLVTRGPFRIVRNPILSGTLTTILGLALMVPNVVAIGMLIAVVVSLEIQVRLVEEPYLLGVHGDAYREYAARTGRFVPWLGRLRRDRSA